MDRRAAAQQAKLVLYAFDMCEANWSQLTPPPDPRIAPDGWTLRAYISGADVSRQSGLTSTSTVMGMGDVHCYGFVAQDASGNFAVAIRGTKSLPEWIDDLDFLMVPHPVGGLVDRGFYNIYQSMQLHVLGGGPGWSPLASGMSALVGASPVTVLGHSLGSAISTYLTLDLRRLGLNASACLFASPKTGDSNFVNAFEQNVPNYDVFNYAHDLVPQLPPFDILHCSKYRDLLQAKIFNDDFSMAKICQDKACFHHLVCYMAMLDYPTYTEVMANMPTDDDIACAKCVLGKNA